MSQILSSQGKNAPSNLYPHYLVRLATSRKGGGGGAKKRGGQNLTRRPPTENSFRPPSPRYVWPPPPLFHFLSKPLRNWQTSPQLTSSEAAFGGSRKMVSDGPSSWGFAFRYVLPPPPLALPTNQRLSGGATEAPKPNLLLWTRPPPNPSPQTWFRPDFDQKRKNLGHSIQKIFSLKMRPFFWIQGVFLRQYIWRDFSSEFAPWKCLLKIFFSLWPKFFHL